MDVPGNISAYSATAVEEATCAPERVPAPKATYAGLPAPESETVSAPPGWSPLLRLGFRIAFIYFIGFIWLYGNNPLDMAGKIFWPKLVEFSTWPLNHLAIWTGIHIFHLPHVPAHWHVTHLGDRRINWVLNSLLVAAAMSGGLIWTTIAWLRGSRRTEYRTLLTWLRFFLRLSVGFFMIGYGMIKVFPLQMLPISAAVLNQPAGQMTPEIFLWSFVGLYPIYQVICGVAETLAGALVLFRRTALIGALLSVFLMCNVVLYDLFYDVSVRLFATNLLLAAIFIVLPDTKPLLDFFWRHKTTSQTGTWVPTSTRSGVRAYVRALEIVFIIGCFAVNPLFDGVIWHHRQVMARIQSPLLGAWKLDANQSATGPFITPKGPVAEFYVDTVDRALRRSEDGMLWRTYIWINPAAHTLFVNGYFGANPVTYNWKMPDANHVLLSVIPSKNPKQESKATQTSKPAPALPSATIRLTRIPLPAHYQLLDRTFRFVNHGATER